MGKINEKSQDNPRKGHGFHFQPWFWDFYFPPGGGKLKNIYPCCIYCRLIFFLMPVTYEFFAAYLKFLLLVLPSKIWSRM